MRVEEVTASSKDFMDYLAIDKVGNAFALYDLKEEADRVQCWAARESGSYRGYLLLWYRKRYPNAILRGTGDAAGSLLSKAPMDGITFLAEPHLARCLRESREVRAGLLMDMMWVDRKTARPVRGKRARRLTAADGPSVATLFEEADLGAYRDWAAWIDQGIAYGAFEGRRLVAVGGTHVQSEDICLVGGVYTAKNYRRRGYAAEVNSAIMQEALWRVPQVSLMVVSANRPAVRLYEKLGYRKVGEWAWMDVGTGRLPLM